LKKLVVFSGAGISAESGLKTFRDNNGLWEKYRIEDVATPEAFEKNPELVLAFYNERRKQLRLAMPNKAHLSIAAFEHEYDVTVITQNIDNLHERAGSTNVIHLHGELLKAESSIDPNLVYDLENKDIRLGDVCEKGSQLRPHVVWFGEAVPMMGPALKIVNKADILVTIGTSLEVYPAASLITAANKNCKKIIIDPNSPSVRDKENYIFIQKKASEGMASLAKILSC
jgi:NAD-dependent deacetylase